VKEDREARGLVSCVADDDLRRGLGAEQRVTEAVLGGDHLVRQLFVLGQPLDHLEDQGNVSCGPISDLKFHDQLP
jgi:hypothetical protein